MFARISYSRLIALSTANAHNADALARTYCADSAIHALRVSIRRNVRLMRASVLYFRGDAR